MAEKAPDEKPETQAISDVSDKPDEEEGIAPEILKKVPPEFRSIVEFGMGFGPVPNPLLRKITSEHIDKILDLSGKDGERVFQDAQSSRRYTLTYGIIGAALFIFITIYLAPMDKQLYLEIVKSLVLFGGGFGAGFGVKSYLDKNKA